MPGFARIYLLLSLVLFTSCSADRAFPVVDLTLNGKLYHIEVADTQNRKSRGLMFRESIKRNAGMLFPYDSPVHLNIWMKNTLIPLAVLWLDDEARIIYREILQPCRTANCPSFGPEQRSMYALELHPAELDRFKVGEQLEAILDWNQGR
jgi:hypothetical protein